jgi:hypothetical protein
MSLFMVGTLIPVSSVAQQASQSGPTRAATKPNVYQSAKGYRLTYPPGWQIADRADLGGADVDVLIHPPSKNPIRYFNVIVSPNIVPATPHYLGEFKKGITEQISKVSAPQNLDVRLTKVGRYDAILASWIGTTPASGSWWQEQFVIPGESHTFIITCTSTADTSAAAGPIFEKILATFEIHEAPRSGRIHEILQEARAREAEDARIRTSLGEVIARQPQSFAEFKKQCADLKVVIDESDAMEKKKRQMLAELQVRFGNDAHVKGIFNMLIASEDASDKVEMVLRGMTACSGILESAPSSKQDAYRDICIEPAQEQLNLIFPEIKELGGKLQDEIQKYGGSLPPDFLKAIAQ